jgi:hypothetical protein
MKKIKLKNEYSITCPFLWGERGRGWGNCHIFEKNDYFGYISNLISVW